VHVDRLKGGGGQRRGRGAAFVSHPPPRLLMEVGGSGGLALPLAGSEK